MKFNVDFILKFSVAIAILFNFKQLIISQNPIPEGSYFGIKKDKRFSYKVIQKRNGKIKFKEIESYETKPEMYDWTNSVKEFDSYGNEIKGRQYDKKGKLRSENVYIVNSSDCSNHKTNYYDKDKSSEYLFKQCEVKTDSSTITIDSAFKNDSGLQWVSYYVMYNTNYKHQYYTTDENGNLNHLVSSYQKFSENKIEHISEFYSKDSILELVDKTIKDTIDNSKIYFRIENGDTVSMTYTKYNDTKHEVYRKGFDEKGAINFEFYFEYEFDSKGNWIRKMVYDREKKLTHIVIRDLEYWKY